jgi:hypothetical protein
MTDDATVMADHERESSSRNRGTGRRDPMMIHRNGIRRKIAIGTIALGAIAGVGIAAPAYGFTGLALPGVTKTVPTTTPTTTAQQPSNPSLNFSNILW